MPHATVCDRHKTLVPAGERCAECVTDDNRRRGRKSSAHGVTSSRWRRRRRAKLRRNPRCELELDGCTGLATTVHIPPRYGGRHDRVPEAELVSACAHCHGVTDGARAHAARR